MRWTSIELFQLSQTNKYLSLFLLMIAISFSKNIWVIINVQLKCIERINASEKDQTKNQVIYHYYHLLHIPSEFFCLVTATTSLFTDTKILMLKLFFVFFDTPERSQQHDTTYIKIKSEFQIKRIAFSSECNFLFTSDKFVSI